MMSERPSRVRACLAFLSLCVVLMVVFLFFLWFRKFFAKEVEKINRRLIDRILIVGSWAWVTYIEELKSLVEFSEEFIADMQGILDEPFKT